MYLPEAPWCKASVTRLVYRKKNSEEKDYPSYPGHGGQGDHTSQTTTKDWNESYYVLA